MSLRALALTLWLLPALVAAAPPMRGVAVGMWAGSEPDRAVEEIAGLGASHVALAVFWRQRDVRASEIAPAAEISTSDERLRAAIRRARAIGLEVFLLPIVDVEVRRPGEWRGTLAPADLPAWWRAYHRFILHYAALAAEEEVALFAVGSELAATEAWRDRWYGLISAVRRRYPGKLVYSANWDHFEKVSFWERLDYVGVTGYNELTRDDDASEDELLMAWRQVRARLVGFAARAGRPLVLTEVGYTSQNGAARRPWDYTVRARVDVEEQRRCYAAFVRAWRGDPALAGVFFWEWGGRGGLRDAGYTPRGKPAEIVLRSWFGMK
jgi:hypothetical protein